MTSSISWFPEVSASFNQHRKKVTDSPREAMFQLYQPWQFQNSDCLSVTPPCLFLAFPERPFLIVSGVGQFFVHPIERHLKDFPRFQTELVDPSDVESWIRAVCSARRGLKNPDVCFSEIRREISQELIECRKCVHCGFQTWSD